MVERERSVKPILLIDFDGVIHSYVSGWQGADVANDPPVEGAGRFIHRALEYFDVYIYSSRSRQPGGEDCMREYLFRHFGQIAFKVAYPLQKPAAFMTIDDRCFCFEGTWPDVQTLREFKPWNKK